jgi:branched-chain amino acid transport system permease protein
MLQQLLFNGLIAGCIYALIALGFAVIYRTVKFFHFAHGVVYAFGAYIAYAIFAGISQKAQVTSYQTDFGSQSSVIWIIAIIAGVIGAGIVGVLIDRIIYRPLRKRKAPNLVFLIASSFRICCN